MKENFEIVATTRDVQGKGSSRRLRHEGQVPGIIYGGDAEPTMFATNHNELLLHLADARDPLKHHHHIFQTTETTPRSVEIVVRCHDVVRELDAALVA